MKSHSFYTIFIALNLTTFAVTTASCATMASASEAKSLEQTEDTFQVEDKDFTKDSAQDIDIAIETTEDEDTRENGDVKTVLVSHNENGKIYTYNPNYIPSTKIKDEKEQDLEQEEPLEEDNISSIDDEEQTETEDDTIVKEESIIVQEDSKKEAEDNLEPIEPNEAKIVYNEESNDDEELEKLSDDDVFVNKPSENVAEAETEEESNTQEERLQAEDSSNEITKQEEVPISTPTPIEEVSEDNENIEENEETQITQEDTNVPQEENIEGEQEQITDNIEAQDEEQPALTQETEEIKPSRKMTAYKNQYIDVEYPGKGWIYLGEQNDVNLIRYLGSKIGGENTNFSMRAKDAGTTLLHFYKMDALTSSYIDDYLQIVINEEVSKTEESSKAPIYDGSVQNTTFVKTASPQTTSQIALAESTDSSENTSSVVENMETPGSQEAVSDEEVKKLLEQAQNAYSQKSYKECLSILTDFFNKASSSLLDEGLFLQAQALEAPSSERNIKAALDIYETIVKRYPKSSKWQQANERIIYLRRLYFDIR